jgi:hypothetical protein
VPDAVPVMPACLVALSLLHYCELQHVGLFALQPVAAIQEQQRQWAYQHAVAGLETEISESEIQSESRPFVLGCIGANIAIILGNVSSTAATWQWSQRRFEHPLVPSLWPR